MPSQKLNSGNTHRTKRRLKPTTMKNKTQPIKKAKNSFVRQPNRADGSAMSFGERQRAYFSAFRGVPGKDILYLLYATCYVIGAEIIRFAERVFILVQEIFFWFAGRILLGNLRKIIRLFHHRVVNAIAASFIHEVNFFIDTSLKIRDQKQKVQEISTRKTAEGLTPQLQAVAVEQSKQLVQYQRQFTKRMVFSLANYIGPVLAVVALLFVFSSHFQYTVALAIEYEGKNLGYIENEKVFDTAANDIESRVISGDEPFYVNDPPLYHIAFVKKNTVAAVTDFSNTLLQSIMGDKVNQACGIYLDGEFLLAVTEEAEIQAYMQNLLKPYLAGNEDAEVDFLNEVEYRSGLYPIGSIRTFEDATAKISSKKTATFSYTVVKNDTVAKVASKNGLTKAELLQYNPDIGSKMIAGKKITITKAQPFIQVKVVKVETYTQVIAYTTTIKKDTSHYEGYSYIQTKGRNGERKVTANVIYVDGIEIRREVLTSTTTKNARAEVKVVGTKETPKYAPSVSTYGVVVTGKFMWPTEPGHISCGWYGYSGHRGVDLSAKVGTPIYAADGGVVQAVYKKSYGYGYHIIISHGNGYSTLYAHLSKIKVSVGDKVAKGQVIALSGNTGRTTGPHLHFEIRINGVQVNPTPYIT